MGKENNVMLSFLDDNERFADLFNYAYFGGEQVVKAEELQEASEVYISKAERRGRQRTRDIKKRLKSGKELKILAVESQSQVSYIMPWRCMDYDCREYGKQISEIQGRNHKTVKNGEKKVYTDAGERLCEFKRSDYITPVYTLCVYHGTEVWDGPRSLRDMMDFGDAEAGWVWERCFADYPMRLICVNELVDCSGFRTSLKELFQLLPYRKNKRELKRLLQENPEYRRMDAETARTIGELMGVEGFMEKEEQYRNGEGYNMCQALQEMMEDSRQEGITEGIKEGICALIQENLDEDISHERILEKLQKYFSLSEEAALEMLNLFIK